MADGPGRHADRTQQIGPVTIVMALGLPVIRRNNRRNLRGQAMLEALAVDGMNVTKRQADVDGERKERQPRSAPDMVTKPTHRGRQNPLSLTCKTILDYQPKPSNAWRDHSESEKEMPGSGHWGPKVCPTS
jgi:hypothetical protein